MEQILVRPVDVAKAMGVCRATVYQLIASGDLPAIRIGRAVRVPVVALQEWIEAAKVRPAPTRS